MAESHTTPLTLEAVELLRKFSNHLFARCGMAESTIELLVGYIRRMIPQTGLHPSPESLDGYIASIRRAKMSHAHLSNALKAVERYMTFLGEPIEFQRPKKPSGIQCKVLSEGKIALIIASAPTLRERMMLMVFAYTGCRNRELTNFRFSDIDIPEQALRVRPSKNERARMLPLAGECLESLMEYMRQERYYADGKGGRVMRRGTGEDHLFVSARWGHPLQTQDVRKVVRVAAKRAKIPGRVWPHLFRHSLATAMLSRGASIYSIQAILGHTFISTTMDYYLHPSSRNVKADYHRCAPSFV